MAYLHCQIRTLVQTPNPMATLHYAEVFTLHGVRFRFQLPTTLMGSESESVPESVRVPTRHGKPEKMRVHLGNLEISWNFEKFNKYHGKMPWNLEKLGGY